MGFLSEFRNLGFLSPGILSLGILSVGFLSCGVFVGNPYWQYTDLSILIKSSCFKFSLNVSIFVIQLSRVIKRKF